MTLYEAQPPGKGSRETEGALRMPFVEMLEKRQRAANSLLCVGLDPVIESIPNSFRHLVMKRPQYEILIQVYQPEDITMLHNSRILEEFSREIIDATHPFVSAYKPNMGFWERYVEFGVGAARRVIEHIRQVDPTIPVLLDGKRADIGPTNIGYTDMVDSMGADAVTVNPYFGIEGQNALDPFLHMENTGIIVLCRTSNPEAARMQDQLINDEELGMVPYFMMVAHMAEKARQKYPNIAIVVGATVSEQLKAAREVFKGPILVPGLGKQGGRPEDLIGVFDERGLGVIANNSSGIIHASKEDDFAQVAAEQARRWRDAINEVRQAA